MTHSLSNSIQNNLHKHHLTLVRDFLHVSRRRSFYEQYNTLFILENASSSLSKRCDKILITHEECCPLQIIDDEAQRSYLYTGNVGFRWCLCSSQSRSAGLALHRRCHGYSPVHATGVHLHAEQGAYGTLSID